MTLDQKIALLGHILTFIGLLYVGFQFKSDREQRKLEAQLQIYSINREIISLGFSTPELFHILHGQKADPLFTRHYLQLWVNQFAMIHAFEQSNLISRDMRESLSHDMGNFLKQENMRLHWEENEADYPASFRKFVRKLQNEKTGVSEKHPPRKQTLTNGGFVKRFFSRS